jgi:hypothetical protein
MCVHEIDQIVACNEHVSPRPKVLFDSIARRNSESDLGIYSSDGLRWIGYHLDFDVLI